MTEIILQNPPFAEIKDKGWYVDITLQYAEFPNEEDFVFDVMDSLEECHPAVAVQRNKKQLFLNLFIEKEGYLEALSWINKTISNNPLTASARVVSAEVKTEKQLDEELNTPAIPELVSYVEIGEICNVTRQRARVLAGKEGFPEPLVITSQGPLFGKHAVQAWERNRSTRPGRPPRKNENFA